jgi:hypothetical protein
MRSLRWTVLEVDSAPQSLPGPQAQCMHAILCERDLGAAASRLACAARQSTRSFLSPPEYLRSPVHGADDGGAQVKKRACRQVQIYACLSGATS